MTDIRKRNEKSKERFNNGIRSIHSDKCICKSADVLRPNFGGHLNRPDTSISLLHEQLGEQTANLLQHKGEPSDQEADRGRQADADLGEEEQSDLKHE